MPELPEVETVVRDLRPYLVHQMIQKISCGKKQLRRPWKIAWNKKITNQVITKIDRRGKWILIHLNHGGVLIIHLGMTGQLTVHSPSDPIADHVHFRLLLQANPSTNTDQSSTDKPKKTRKSVEKQAPMELRFRDIRRFGSVEFFADLPSWEDHHGEMLGPEPFDLTKKEWQEAVQKSNRSLKALLLDQSIVAGIGNIYADESLFEAKLLPTRFGSQLSFEEMDRLRLAIRKVLKKAIESRGSTIRNYVGGSGLQGEYQEVLAVYGRGQAPCLICGTEIQVIRLAGRSTHFCPHCQK